MLNLKKKTAIDYVLVCAIHDCCLFLCCYKTCFTQFGLAKGRISGLSLDLSLNFYNMERDNSLHNFTLMTKTQRGYISGLSWWYTYTLCCKDDCWKVRWKQTCRTMVASWKEPTGSILCQGGQTPFTILTFLTSRGHSGPQRPLLPRELPSLWPTPLRIDRAAPWRNWTGYGGFGKPCHVERSSNLPKQNLYGKIAFLLQNHSQSLCESLEPPWPLIKALNLSCPWRSAELCQIRTKLHTLPRNIQVNYVFYSHSLNSAPSLCLGFISPWIKTALTYGLF